VVQDLYVHAARTHLYAGQTSPGNLFIPVAPPLPLSPQRNLYYDAPDRHQVQRSGTPFSKPEVEADEAGKEEDLRPGSPAPPPPTAGEIGRSERDKDRLQSESPVKALLAKAIREKELADAATAASENTEREAMTAAAIAKVEYEKAIAEAQAAYEKSLANAKAAANAAEAAKKAAEAEPDANKPGPDADKAPIKFEDAVGRNFTLPWHLAKTWKGMEALIKQAFVNIEHIGPHVADGHYHLLGPNNEIILPQVWEVVVQPGWDIKMELWALPEPTKLKLQTDANAFGAFKTSMGEPDVTTTGGIGRSTKGKREYGCIFCGKVLVQRNK